MNPQDPNPPAEERDSLWLLTFAPTIWAGHFLLCYLTAAIWCGKYAPPGAGLDWVREAVAIYTGLALTGIGVVAWFGFRRHTFGAETVPHDFDTRGDRHRFLGFATLLLAGLSAVAVAYVGLVVVFVETCR